MDAVVATTGGGGGGGVGVGVGGVGDAGRDVAGLATALVAGRRDKNVDRNRRISLQNR